MRQLSKANLVAVLFLSAPLTGCGSSGSGIGGDALRNIGLSDLPSASTMVGTSDSSTALRRALAGRALVTGDEFLPLFTTLTSNPDQYFWNGLLATINAGGYSYDSNDAQPFWDGRGACWMVQSFGQSFKNVLEGGSTLCYMKNIPVAASGVTLTGSTKAQIFTPTANDKEIRIAIKNMQEEDSPPSDSNMNIRVSGTNRVGTNKLEYKLWACENSAGVARNLEVLTVNLDTGAFTTTSLENNQPGAGISTLSGFLSQGQDGKLNWDLERSREATVQKSFSFGGGVYSNEGISKSMITIDGDQLSSKMYETRTNNWNDGAPQSSVDLNKRFLTSIFEGSNLETLKLRQVASVESVVQTGGPWGDASFSHSTAKDWNATNSSDGYYATQVSGTLYDLVNAYSFGSDDFYSATLSAPDVSISDEEYPCDGAVDVEVEMDFSDSALQAVQASCDIPWGEYDTCWSGDVMGAERKIFQGQF